MSIWHEYAAVMEFVWRRTAAETGHYEATGETGNASAPTVEC